MIREALVRQRAATTLGDTRVEQPPVDLDLVARAVGIRIRREANLPPGLKACYDDVRFEVRVRERLSGNEERFAIAHEIGHHVLEHGGQECWNLGLAGESLPIDELDVGVDFEAEASRFASELLVPRAWCRADLVKGLQPGDIAIRYRVSREVAFIAIDTYRFRLPRGRGRR